MGDHWFRQILECRLQHYRAHVQRVWFDLKACIWSWISMACGALHVFDAMGFCQISVSQVLSRSISVFVNWMNLSYLWTIWTIWWPFPAWTTRELSNHQSESHKHKVIVSITASKFPILPTAKCHLRWISFSLTTYLFLLSAQPWTRIHASQTAENGLSRSANNYF